MLKKNKIILMLGILLISISTIKIDAMTLFEKEEELPLEEEFLKIYEADKRRIADQIKIGQLKKDIKIRQERRNKFAAIKTKAMQKNKPDLINQINVRINTINLELRSLKDQLKEAEAKATQGKKIIEFLDEARRILKDRKDERNKKREEIVNLYKEVRKDYLLSDKELQKRFRNCKNRLEKNFRRFEYYMRFSKKIDKYEPFLLGIKALKEIVEEKTKKKEAFQPVKKEKGFIVTRKYEVPIGYYDFKVISLQEKGNFKGLSSKQLQDFISDALYYIYATFEFLKEEEIAEYFIKDITIKRCTLEKIPEALKYVLEGKHTKIGRTAQVGKFATETYRPTFWANKIIDLSENVIQEIPAWFLVTVDLDCITKLILTGNPLTELSKKILATLFADKITKGTSLEDPKLRARRVVEY